MNKEFSFKKALLSTLVFSMIFGFISGFWGSELLHGVLYDILSQLICSIFITVISYKIFLLNPNFRGYLKSIFVIPFIFLVFNVIFTEIGARLVGEIYLLEVTFWAFVQAVLSWVTVIIVNFLALNYSWGFQNKQKTN